VLFTSPVLAGTKVGDIPVQHLDAAFDLAKFTDDIVDITKVTKYGDNAIKHGDNVFIKNADGSIRHVDEIEDLVQIDRAVRDIESSGFQFPCVVPSFAYNSLNTLFPVAYASGGCVAKISDTKIKIGDEVFEAGDEVIEKIVPEQFLKGKEFEKVINNLGITKDENFLQSIAQKAGTSVDELKNMQHLTQVHIKMENGKYIVADDVWVKRVIDQDDKVSSELIINETKLNAGVDLSPNQATFKEYLDNGTRDFSLRSSRFKDIGLEQGSNLNIKGITRTVGDGTGNYSVINF
jgi:hypothetical protein